MHVPGKYAAGGFTVFDFSTSPGKLFFALLSFSIWKKCIVGIYTYLNGLVWIPVTLKLVFQCLLQLLSEYINSPPGQFVVQIGDYEVERNLYFDVHRGDSGGGFNWRERTRASV